MHWLEEQKENIRTRALAGRWPASSVLAIPQALGGLAILKKTSQWLLCLNRDHCAENCQSCVAFIDDAHPDVMVLAPDESQVSLSIKIDQLRELMDRLSGSSTLGGAQVLRIEQAERMTQQCANALLKTLEEPKKGLYIVMQTDHVSQLLPTIRSRTHIERVQYSTVQQEAYFDQVIAKDSPYCFLRFTHGKRPMLINAIIKDDQVLIAYRNLGRFLQCSACQPLATLERLSEMSTDSLVEALLFMLEALMGKKTQACQRAMAMYDAFVRSGILEQTVIPDILQLDNVRATLLETQRLIQQPGIAGSRLIRDALMLNLHKTLHG
jgi:DNA polymerase-3 subunit delta'